VGDPNPPPFLPDALLDFCFFFLAAADLDAWRVRSDGRGDDGGVLMNSIVLDRDRGNDNDDDGTGEMKACDGHGFASAA